MSRTTVATCAAAALLATLTSCASSGSGFGAGSGHAVAARPAATVPIVAWYRESGPKISTVEQSITYAQWMVRRPGHTGLIAACTRIQTGVDAVRAAPSAPDAGVRTEIAAEMQAFERAAAQCVSGRLEAAGRSVVVGHQHAEVAGKRVVALLHAAS